MTSPKTKSKVWESQNVLEAIQDLLVQSLILGLENGSQREQTVCLDLGLAPSSFPAPTLEYADFISLAWATSELQTWYPASAPQALPAPSPATDCLTDISNLVKTKLFTRKFYPPPPPGNLLSVNAQTRNSIHLDPSLSPTSPNWPQQVPMILPPKCKLNLFTSTSAVLLWIQATICHHLMNESRSLATVVEIGWKHSWVSLL